MLGGIGILFGFLVLGEAVALTGIGVPGNVIGMILLAAALGTGLVKPRWIEGAANTMLRNLAFFFLPAGVGLMTQLDTLRAYWPALTVAVVGSLIAVLIVVGVLAQWKPHAERNR